LEILGIYFKLQIHSNKTILGKFRGHVWSVSQVENNEVELGEEDFDIQDNPNIQNPIIIPQELGTAVRPTGGHPKPGAHTRGWKKREIFKAADGSALIERGDHCSGKAHIVGEGIYVPLKSLPQEAKFVSHANQFAKKRQGLSGPTTYDDYEEEEDEDLDQQEKPKRQTLSDFLSPSTKLPPPPPIPHYLTSAEALVASITSHVEFVNNLPANDPEVNTIIVLLKQMQAASMDFIQAEENAATLEALLSSLDLVNTTLNKCK